ncbi:MAG: hypothetical protein JNN27_16970 [Planctomycetes bacterium]|nr:hypothetical protein [Planctomycetota bacterium]
MAKRFAIAVITAATSTGAVKTSFAIERESHQNGARSGVLVTDAETGWPITGVTATLAESVVLPTSTVPDFSASGATQLLVTELGQAFFPADLSPYRFIIITATGYSSLVVSVPDSDRGLSLRMNEVRMTKQHSCRLTLRDASGAPVTAEGVDFVLDRGSLASQSTLDVLPVLTHGSGLVVKASRIGPSEFMFNAVPRTKGTLRLKGAGKTGDPVVFEGWIPLEDAEVVVGSGRGAGGVRGNVVSSESRGLSGRVVWALPAIGENPRFFTELDARDAVSARTDEFGRFSIPALSSGTWHVGLAPLGQSGAESMRVSGLAAALVRVSPSSISVVPDFELEAWSTAPLELCCEKPPKDGVQFFVRGIDVHCHALESADSASAQLSTRLPPGRYEVAAYGTNESAAVYVSTSKLVQVPGGPECFSLRTVSKVHGLLFDAVSGRPLAGELAVQEQGLTDANSVPWTCHVGENGAFQLYLPVSDGYLIAAITNNGGYGRFAVRAPDIHDSGFLSLAVVAKSARSQVLAVGPNSRSHTYEVWDDLGILSWGSCRGDPFKALLFPNGDVRLRLLSDVGCELATWSLDEVAKPILAP